LTSRYRDSLDGFDRTVSAIAGLAMVNEQTPNANVRSPDSTNEPCPISSLIGATMATPEQNKQLVLEAFDTLFNRRDYARAETYWSPHYIQHSAHIPPGRDGLFSLVKGLPDTLRHETELIMAEGDLVLLRGRFSGHGQPAPWIVVGRHRRRSIPRGLGERAAHVRRHLPRRPRRSHLMAPLTKSPAARSNTMDVSYQFAISLGSPDRVS
jgi:predicted SnoaL-like aldol condensation-catalyzing enzyme